MCPFAAERGFFLFCFLQYLLWNIPLMTEPEETDTPWVFTHARQLAEEFWVHVKVVIVQSGWISSVMRWAGWLMKWELPWCRWIDPLVSCSQWSRQLPDLPPPPSCQQSITQRRRRSYKHCHYSHQMILWFARQCQPTKNIRLLIYLEPITASTARAPGLIT